MIRLSILSLLAVLLAFVTPQQATANPGAGLSVNAGTIAEQTHGRRSYHNRYHGHHYGRHHGRNFGLFVGPRGGVAIFAGPRYRRGHYYHPRRHHYRRHYRRQINPYYYYGH